MRISDWSSDVCSSDLVILSIGCSAHHPTQHHVPEENQIIGDQKIGEIHRVGHLPSPLQSSCSSDHRQRLVLMERRRRAQGPLTIGMASCRERVCKYV